MIAAAQSGQMPLAAWVSILVGLAGVAVLLLKAGQKAGGIEEHLETQDERFDRQDKALARQDDVLDAQNAALAALEAKVDDLRGEQH